MNDLKIKFLRNCYGAPPYGSYALDSQNFLRWQTCREQFLASLNNNSNAEGFFFCHKGSRFEDISSFISKFEDIVFYNTVKGELVKSEFVRTNYNSVSWFIPSNFWKKSLLKMSLLISLLKTSKNYTCQFDNFDKTLFDPEFPENFYIRNTRFAVLRFMFGFTEFFGCLQNYSKGTSTINNGWYSIFNNVGKETVVKLLRRKDSGSSCCEGFLWK
jgi:hypothetical protein